MISDLFRWGRNEDLNGSRGPIIEFDERVSFWGKGMAEIRVEATASPTAYSGEVDQLFRRNVTGDSAESAL